MTRRFANGIQFAANYRWSKSLDTLSYEGPGFVTNQTFPQNQRSEYGPSDFDTPHYFTFSGVYELPFLQRQPGLVGRLLGGLSVSGIFTASSGFPWTPTTCAISTATPGGPTLCPIRPIAYLGGAGHDTSNDAYLSGSNFTGGGSKYFVISNPSSGTATLPPGVGRNTWRGPGFVGTDLSLCKRTNLIGELVKLDLRANFYNVFNKLNLQPVQFGSAGATIESSTFGISQSAMSGRVVELLARVTF